MEKHYQIGISNNFSTSNLSLFIPPGDKDINHYHTNLEFILHAYVYPVIYAVGIPGNLISFAMWIHPKLRNSSACYFAAIAIYDTIVLLLHLIMTIRLVGDIEILDSDILCEGYNVLYLSSEIMAMLLILGLTVDRYIIVHFPMKKHHFCTKSRSVKVIVCLTVFALALGITEGSFWTYDKVAHECITRSAVNIKSGSHVVEVGNITILIMGILVPVLLVLVLNLVIVNKLRKILVARKQMMACREHKRHDNDSTIMLLALSCYLILSEIPDSILYLLKPFFLPPTLQIDNDKYENHSHESSYQRANERYENYLLTAAVFGTFSLTNYAINILIYSLAGHKFRHTLIKIFKRTSKSAQNSHSDDFSRYTAGVNQQTVEGQSPRQTGYSPARVHQYIPLQQRNDGNIEHNAAIE